MGSIVLAITGAEALYADMGHFGRRYIAIAWYAVAFPGLVLNYFGQGAYILARPSSTENPFFAMAPPGFARVALTGVSIVAAIIASQALISGAYSLTRQAIQLGYFPRLKINYTNTELARADLRTLRQHAARLRLHPHRSSLRLEQSGSRQHTG